MDKPHKKNKPCPDHFLVMPDGAKRYASVCNKCGWKVPDGSWYLKHVKMDNRYYFDH
jgi:hypothetical protein